MSYLQSVHVEVQQLFTKTTDGFHHYVLSCDEVSTLVTNNKYFIGKHVYFSHHIVFLHIMYVQGISFDYISTWLYNQLNEFLNIFCLYFTSLKLSFYSNSIYCGDSNENGIESYI